MTAAIDITPEQRKILLTLLRRFFPGVAVWAYGSRVKWTARPNSDLDLVAFATPAQSRQVSELKEALAESNLPFLVDFHVWDEVPEKFHEVIRKEYVVVQEARQAERGKGMAGDARPFGELFAEGTRNGLTRPKAVRGAGVKMVNMGELFAYPRLRNAPMDRVPLIEAEAERFLLKPGDLLFARQSLVLEGAGKCSIFLNDDEPVTFESHVTRVRLDPREADPRFYFYYLQSHHGRAAIKSIVEQGAGASGIRGSDLERLDVLWRPVPEQRAIAHVLGILDDKIELNRRMNETLEAMARALFKSWFVDFDPVRAKAEGRDPGLPKPLADLFPDSFEDSDLGEIPKGWGVGSLDSVLVLQRGFDLPATQRTSGAYPVLSASGPSGTHSEFMVQGPGVTTGRSGVLGKVFYVDSGFWPLNTSLWVKEFRHSRPAYAFHLLRGIDFASFNAGSAVPTLNRNHVHNLPTLRPPMGLINAFEKIARESLDRQKHNDDQSRTLAVLRDALLPKLISGEMRVANTDQFLREAI